MARRPAPIDPEIQQRMEIRDELVRAFEAVNKARLACLDAPGFAGYAADLRKMQDEINGMCRLA